MIDGARRIYSIHIIITCYIFSRDIDVPDFGGSYENGAAAG